MGAAIPRLLATLCAGTFLCLSEPASAIGVEERLAQLQAGAGAFSEAAVSSLIDNMATQEPGVIKIPIKKQ